MGSTSVFVNVADIEKSLKFYKALGFKVTSKTKTKDGKLAYCDLDLDGAEVGLGWIGSNDEKDYRAWVGTPLGAGVVIYFTVKDVDKTFKKAKQAGAVVEYEPTTRSYGRVAGINDPDGYVVTLFADAPKAKAVTKAKAKAKAKAKKAVKTSRR